MYRPMPQCCHTLPLQGSERASGERHARWSVKRSPPTLQLPDGKGGKNFGDKHFGGKWHRTGMLRPRVPCLASPFWVPSMAARPQRRRRVDVGGHAAAAGGVHRHEGHLSHQVVITLDKVAAAFRWVEGESVCEGVFPALKLLAIGDVGAMPRGSWGLGTASQGAVRRETAVRASAGARCAPPQRAPTSQSAAGRRGLQRTAGWPGCSRPAAARSAGPAAQQ